MSRHRYTDTNPATSAASSYGSHFSNDPDSFEPYDQTVQDEAPTDDNDESFSLDDNEPKGFVHGLLDWGVTIVCSLCIVFFVHAFVAEAYIVPSGSMLNTVHIQDRLVGEKISYRFSAPKQGDIITFNDPCGTGHTLLKRVIACEGQTVDLKDGKVIVDGQELKEPYTEGKPSYPITNQGVGPQGVIRYPFTVPAHHIWVMGDNRTNSLDSRYFGAVDTREVSSRAAWIFWPFDHARALGH